MPRSKKSRVVSEDDASYTTGSESSMYESPSVEVSSEDSDCSKHARPQVKGRETKRRRSDTGKHGKSSKAKEKEAKSKEKEAMAAKENEARVAKSKEKEARVAKSKEKEAMVAKLKEKEAKKEARAAKSKEKEARAAKSREKEAMAAKEKEARAAKSREARVVKTKEKVKPKAAKNHKAKSNTPNTSDDETDESDDETNESDTSDDENRAQETIDGYRQQVKKFIKRDNMFGFQKIVAETPLAAVLENMHFMFVTAFANDEMISHLININNQFNVVSAKFVESLRKSTSARDCKALYTESERVAEGIESGISLNEIEGIEDYTAEFIIMKTIQVGDLQACKTMMGKWKVVPKFAACKGLIAALYGWEEFFGDKEQFTKTQNLVVHALCGGFSNVLRIVSSGSGARWILPETLQKAGLVCSVRPKMKSEFKKMLAGRP